MKILKFLDENLEKYMCVILFSIIIGFMIVNIFMRFVMKNAIPWASEAVLFIFVWFVWFAISLGFKENSHVRVTALTMHFPKKVSLVLETVINFVIIFGFVVLLYYGVVLLNDGSVVGKTGLLISYPMWSFYLCAPIGLALSIFRIIQNLVVQIKQIRKGDVV
ncbi:TRAP transporter small permease [Chakrabartyella piscis]|uniref:TRAP transporter small permease n=1 Tax=Chakrabartyella piscis TaxID=2918914 RepID=UPI0029589D95|nr:TRAP transporter small permease [Chakrabartyella piscis]